MDITWDDYVFVDVETTGLDENQHEVLEVSYAIGLGEPVTLYPEFHQGIFLSAMPGAMLVNKFFDRFQGSDVGDWFVVNDDCKRVPGVEYRALDPNDRYGVYLDLPLEATFGEWETFVHRIAGKVWVGANPQFDVSFLKKYLSDLEFKLQHHHRLFDVGMYAAGKFGWPKSLGFSAAIEEVNSGLFGAKEIPAPDHTAAGDVLSTRKVFAALTGQDRVLRDLSK